MANPAKLSGRQPAESPAPRSPKLLSDDERWGGSFLSLLKDFLTAPRVRLRAACGRLPFTPETRRTRFLDNLKTALSAEPPVAGGTEHSPLLVHWGSGWGRFLQNLRDFFWAPKLPPLRVTSAPAPPPKEIWTRDENASRAQWISILVHAVIVLLLVVPLFQGTATVTAETPKVFKIGAFPVSEYVMQLPPGNDRAGGGGGGGDRNPIPASEGRLPRASLRPQLTPPSVMILNLYPKLSVEPTLLAPPNIKVPQPDLPNLGDPMASTITNSNGPGHGGGIGTGNDGGVGPDSGPGFGPGHGGGAGGDRFRAGTNGIGEPVCIYCPQPAFTEEARKARYQGVVLLDLTILPDGTPTDVRVVRGLGMGLDEKAIETVRQWRFKPVIGPGNKPVAVDLAVEVNFRLL